MSVTETLYLSFDTTNDLNVCGGSAPIDPSFTLVNQGTGRSVELPDEPVVDGVLVYQWVRGPSQLVIPGQRFVITLNFTAYPTENVFAMETVIIATV
jgi:hypothetical protein